MDVIREIISFVVLPGVGEKKPVSRERPLKFCCSKWIVLLTFKSVKYFFNKQAEYERPFAFLPSYFETPDLHTSQKNERMRSVRNNVSLTVRFVLWRLGFRLYEGSDYCYVFVFCVSIKMFFLR